MSIARNTANRAWLVERLRAEVIGPDPSGEPFELPPDGFLSWEALRAAKKQPNGEEILWQDAPIKRYGAGVLFPRGLTEQGQLAAEAGTASDDQEEELGPDVRIDEELDRKAAKKSNLSTFDDNVENLEVSLTNEYRPAALGLSVLADLSAEKGGFEIEIDCATYRKIDIQCGNDPGSATSRSLWYRQPARDPDGKRYVISIPSAGALSETRIEREVPGLEGRLMVTVVSRRRGTGHEAPQRLVTVCLVNIQEKDEGRIDERCFFQCSLTVRGRSGTGWILPYPEYRRVNSQPGDEDEITRLLYRDRTTFAIGHGCAVDWNPKQGDSIAEVRTNCMPTFETPAISADVESEDGKPIRASMRKLAGLDDSDDGSEELDRLVKAYRSWIEGIEAYDNQDPPVPTELEASARILARQCRDCLERIENGLRFLRSHSETARIAREAFRLANQAMLIAQLRASRDVRTPRLENDRLVWDRPITQIDPADPHPDRGYWRAFQIAFLLMSLRGICDPRHPDRMRVDLIWFPTGGGKTEAYLGLTAFTIFFNRLAGLDTSGADVLMRYTLRLLTAQQFQRAGLLFCAMEYLRRQPGNVESLGEQPFRLGMWVGGAATPNIRSSARSALRRLQRDPDSENPFVLLKCPWCNSRFGPLQVESESRPRRRAGKSGTPARILGYALRRLREGGPETVVYRCDDRDCEFGHDPRIPGRAPLPITVVDEDIFDAPPNLVIGTVDKFAMLAWKPEIRAIFGIGADGVHTGLPPSLIIQDELHLISGPLGSMVGAYETVVEELCTRRNGDDDTIAPKIVASTATISRAREQIRALYGRQETMLFPPNGLLARDSFFSRELSDSESQPAAGRLYAGILAPGHGSLQTTQARVFAALLQYPSVMPIKDDEASERDPWWTLVAFFNSLRELGGAATLLVADARDYLRVLIDRHGFPYGQIRPLLNWEELTSRIRSDQIPAIIQRLEIPFSRDKRGYVRDAVEACLASNIIEVGIDIDRLALMTITGQPKTTSQYIQVSSRIGRRPDAPGLVVTMYSPSKPRDRSHYERFRPYHERLYANVEPTSVTPLSPPAVDRALHGIIVATVRQLSPMAIAGSPRPFPLNAGEAARRTVERMIESRARAVDPEEWPNVQAVFSRRLNEWRAWDPREYGGFGAPPENPPLLHPAGSMDLPTWYGHSWPTLSSLRNVDATCEAEITMYYNELEEDE